MIYIVQNGWQIIVTTLIGLAVGAAYHAAAGRRGRIALGLTITNFVAEAWLTAILAGALILAPPKAGAWVMAIGSAVVIWIGFVVPAAVVSLRSRGIAAGAVAAECGYWLAVMIAEAVVLHAVGLVAPH
ncbi:hypothetical protein [Polymorphobacter megasporae]|uniref:hypothetical protein n=1 Tax=Glacieibacterium megasporae TaxID=2835787 RepID=UPI001C1E726C|nr:hypothetical protein [Polymorphobacter megasporae]UAJ08692.1 hypothetical protein KTC28_09800 [Polymorphobacter megasporae]